MRTQTRLHRSSTEALGVRLDARNDVMCVLDAIDAQGGRLMVRMRKAAAMDKSTTPGTRFLWSAEERMTRPA